MTIKIHTVTGKYITVSLWKFNMTRINKSIIQYIYYNWNKYS